MEARFHSGLFFEDNGGFPFIITAPLVYDSPLLNLTLVVPTGFKTDLASIPQILWNILPPVGRYDAAAVIHDFLFQTGLCSWRKANAVLNEGMTVLNVLQWKRRAIYAGVIVGSYPTWHRYRSNSTITHV